ncbi:hypothetical protein C0992_007382 [Termitomyces sp. T32_za158]|nr:hypothetical protein C0992_007382 [Termitomyces sp. T32_za158]
MGIRPAGVPTPTPAAGFSSRPIHAPAPVPAPPPIPDPLRPNTVPARPPSEAPFLGRARSPRMPLARQDARPAHIHLPRSPFPHEDAVPPLPAPLHFSRPASAFLDQPPYSPFLHPLHNTTPVRPVPLFPYQLHAPAQPIQSPVVSPRPPSLPVSPFQDFAAPIRSPLIHQPLPHVPVQPPIVMSPPPQVFCAPPQALPQPFPPHFHPHFALGYPGAVDHGIYRGDGLVPQAHPFPNAAPVPAPRPPDHAPRPVDPSSDGVKLPPLATIPRLTGSSDWGAWHPPVMALLDHLGLIGHVCPLPPAGSSL